VEDLHLVSVDLVTQSQIPNRDKFWSEGVIKKPLVRIAFTSRRDLQELAQSHAYYIGQTTAFCRSDYIDPARKIMGFPSVLDRNGPVYGFSNRAPSSDKNFQAIQYHLYFDIEQHGITGWRAYDLRHQPEDICIQLSGHRDLFGEIPLWGFRSNILVVPKLALASALTR